MGEGRGCLFETHGRELEFVRRQDPRTVWTFVDGDDDDQYVVSGFHFVNRIGYLISTVAVPEGVDFEVHIPNIKNATPEPVEMAAERIDSNMRLSAIARDHLGIETLVTRNNDALDFHEVAVWTLVAALKAAFAAGAVEVITSTGLPKRFDAYEIAPCRRFREDGECDRFYYEPCEPDEADVWTLYGHIEGEGVEAIGDFESYEQAKLVYARITGVVYGQ